VKPVYLDYNATTPVDPAVADAMIPFLRDEFGNPSSGHYYGVRTRSAVESGRFQVAEMIGCALDEIVFTSGGTESNNYAIRGCAFARRDRGRHIVTTQIEHPAVLQVCQYLEHNGFTVTYLPVDKDGLVSLSDVDNAIRDDTILITVMLANNEVGTVLPIREISDLIKGRDIVFHTDAAQAVGKIPVRVADLGVDLLSIAGHKLYAPKGIGALYIKRGLDLQKFMHGADHELNRRAGTENVLEIVGLGKACELVSKNLDAYASDMRTTRDMLQSSLTKRFPQAKINGHPERRLPNTLSVSFPNVEANTIISEAAGVAVSAGAACHSDSVDVSHVLAAMAIPDSIAMGTLRLTTGRYTTEAEIANASDELIRVVSRLMDSEVTDRSDAIESGEYKLTRFTHGLGCACKLRPQVLEEVLSILPRPDDVRVLVSSESSDDAAIYRLDEDTAIVQTVDFFTPVVDDPYGFGQVAAANSLSDIYAMGARPLFALSVVGFPSNRLPTSVLSDILRGASDKAREAGIRILGGHTVDDTEPKFGLAVTGTVHPGKFWTNTGARVGDTLILTKAIGTGLLSTLVKQGIAQKGTESMLLELMSELNKTASEVLARFEVHACTDVTGFGLTGHLLEMLADGNVGVQIRSSAIPILDGAIDAARSGSAPGGTMSNMEFVSDKVDWSGEIEPATRIVLCDAQTSGGLLAAVDPGYADDAVRSLIEAGVKSAAVVGEFTSSGGGRISVI
jgi:cysteine desulfurase